VGINLLRHPNNVFVFFSLFMCGESMFACYLFLFLYETCNVGVYTCLLVLPLLLYKMYCVVLHLRNCFY
jgi:hypothetical protein